MTVQATRGRFITLEGIDGAGKSTHGAWLVEALTARGLRVVATREPGGTLLGEALRELLLRQSMAHESEALLMFAARREHVVQVIEPALARGDCVLSDRYTDATYAYQGGGHGVSLELIGTLERLLHPTAIPTSRCSSMFRGPCRASGSTGWAHADASSTSSSARRSAFFERVRNAYLDRAAADPRRFRIIDATRPLTDVRADLRRIVDAL